MASDAVVTQASTALLTELRQITMVLGRIDKSLVMLERIAKAMEAQAKK